MHFKHDQVLVWRCTREVHMQMIGIIHGRHTNRPSGVAGLSYMNQPLYCPVEWRILGNLLPPVPPAAAFIPRCRPQRNPHGCSLNPQLQ